MDPLYYTDVMVDVETTGLDPAAHAMIELAIVPFNYSTKKVGIGEEQLRLCIDIPTNKGWDNGTLSWWQNEARRDKLQSILRNQIPPRMAADQLTTYLDRFKGGPVNLWAWRASFDWNFLSRFLNENTVPHPFKFTRVIDVPSMVKGRYGFNKAPKIQRGAHHHLATLDCLEQLRFVFDHLPAEVETA